VEELAKKLLPLLAPDWLANYITGAEGLTGCPDCQIVGYLGNGEVGDWGWLRHDYGKLAAMRFDDC